MDRGAWWATVHGVTKSAITEQPTLSLLFFKSSTLITFPGNSVVKNPLANAGYTGSIPVQEGSTCWGADKPWATTTEPNLRSSQAATVEAREPRACALHREKPPQGEGRTPQLESGPTPCSWRKPEFSSEDPAQPGRKKKSRPTTPFPLTTAAFTYFLIHGYFKSYSSEGIKGVIQRFRSQTFAQKRKHEVYKGADPCKQSTAIDSKWCSLP